MSRERPRVPMYRCRTAGPRPLRGGPYRRTPGCDLVDVAPFLAWLDERHATIRRSENEHPAIRVGRGSNATAKGNPILGGEAPQATLMLSVGWSPEAGVRRWAHWRSGGDADDWDFSGYVPRDLIETALIHTGLRFEDVYPVGWDAPCAAWLRRVLILHAIAEALDTLVAREWAARHLAKRPSRSSFALLAEKVDAERWDVVV